MKLMKNCGMNLKNGKILNRKKTDKMKYIYAIIPVTFANYNEYVDCLNAHGSVGWEFVAMIREYKDSPSDGLTTHDYVCKQKLK